MKIEVENDGLFKKLSKEAQYALNSHSRDLVYEAYGREKLAVELKLITRGEFRQLNTRLITKGLNDPAHCRLE